VLAGGPARPFVEHHPTCPFVEQPLHAPFAPERPVCMPRPLPLPLPCLVYSTIPRFLVTMAIHRALPAARPALPGFVWVGGVVLGQGSYGCPGRGAGRGRWVTHPPTHLRCATRLLPGSLPAKSDYGTAAVRSAPGAVLCCAAWSICRYPPSPLEALPGSPPALLEFNASVCSVSRGAECDWLACAVCLVAPSWSPAVIRGLKAPRCLPPPTRHARLPCCALLARRAQGRGSAPAAPRIGYRGLAAGAHALGHAAAAGNHAGCSRVGPLPGSSQGVRTVCGEASSGPREPRLVAV
jgi:hypothetical protein